MVFSHYFFFGQSCLPEGITFTTQEEIDNFQTNYPGCTEIEGDVTINDFWIASITNLNGLSMLTSIGGSLFVYDNHYLTSLTGLENVSSIGGSLLIAGNALTNLMGLDGLTSIGGSLSIGDTWSMEGNPDLVSLEGLENVTSIGGSLTVCLNYALTSLSGLEGLTSVGSYIYILQNVVLTSLTGLENIDAGHINELAIIWNFSLTTCDVQSICDYLASPTGTIKIHDNAPGCNSQAEVTGACGISLPCQPDYYFTSQTEINYFPSVYPNCTVIEGNVIISGSDITNLNGLNVVTSIGGNLEITSNDALTSLTRLEGLTSIGGNLEVTSNDNLTSLSGLEGLISIGGYLKISNNFALTSLTGLHGLRSINGSLEILGTWNLCNLTGLEGLTSLGGILHISGNDALTSMTGLDDLTSTIGNIYIMNNSVLTNLNGLNALTSIGGGLYITQNDSLTSLTGLDNIDATSIGNLYIKWNYSLSTCEIQSICDYLANNPSGDIQIYNNATGCNSQAEVQAACEGLGEEGISIADNFTIFPNPFSRNFTINFNQEDQTPVNLVIQNNLGQVVATLVDEPLAPGWHQVNWNAENLPTGVYYYRLKTGNQLISKKIIKMN
jgi:hypothetical protein